MYNSAAVKKEIKIHVILIMMHFHIIILLIMKCAEKTDEDLNNRMEECQTPMP